MRRNSADLETMTKDQLDAEKVRRDIKWGWIPQIATIVTVFLGIGTYFYTWNHDRQIVAEERVRRDQEGKRSEAALIRESKKPYLEKQLAVFVMTSRILV
jgi:hypothetical protein